MLWEQIRLSLKRNRAYTLCVWVLMLISLTLMMVSLSEYSRVQNRAAFYHELTGQNYYRLFDNYLGEEEAVFLEEQDNLTRLKRLYGEFKRCGAFQYLSMVSQPVYGKDLPADDRFLDGYENGAMQKDADLSESETGYRAYRCVQMEYDAIAHFGLGLSQGDPVRRETWDHAGETKLPALLGSAYRGKVSLGDTFRINYLGLFTTIEVAGFLREGSGLIHMDEMETLDRSIVLPFLNPGIPSDTQEKQVQLRMYLQKLSGTIVSPTTPAEVQEVVTGLCRRCDVLPFSVDGAMGSLELFQMEADEFAALFLTFSSLLLAVSTVVMALVTVMKLRRQFDCFAVHLAFGAEMRHICSYIAGEVWFLLGTAAAAATALAYLLTLGRLALVPFSLLLCGAVGIFITVLLWLLIKQQRLTALLRRSRE